MIGRAFSWLGDNPAGALCAGFLFYVTIGGLTAHLIAVPLDGHPGCWPAALRYVIIVDCADPLAAAFWYAAAELPNSFLRYPTIALLLMTSSTDPNEYNAAIVTYMAGVFAIVVFVGFTAWYTQARVAAWLLLALLIGQIVYFRLLAEYGERLFR